jgi:hypothetical protein
LQGFRWTDDKLLEIATYPHILGHMTGKDKLTELHSDWIKYIWGEEQDHRSLQGHRGSYKTTAITVIGSVWYLLFHPDTRIAIVRKTFTDASECIQMIREMMQTREFISLFSYAHKNPPIMRKKQDASLVFSFKQSVTPEGNIDAYGIHTGITGKHYDRVICDDIITIEDRISKAEREKTKVRIQELRTNIIDPGKPVAFIGTPWHKNDGWTECPEPEKYPVDQTGILTIEEQETKRRTITPVLWACNYELLHQSDDKALFQDPTYELWMTKQGTAFAQLDSAYDGDHFCALTLMSRKANGRLQAIGWVYSGNVKDWYAFIEAKYKKYFCTTLLNEVNADKGFVASALRNHGMRVIEYSEKENKHLKISTHLYKHWLNIDWDPDTDPEYMEQVVDYREGNEPDDAPDSASSLLREKFNENSHRGVNFNSNLFKM